ncbi:hypothetical protein JW935_06945 [candidate division KSB1 bacterium]|nr:hypothetical protein [candidate division KSB1 bacterium]
MAATYDRIPDKPTRVKRFNAPAPSHVERTVDPDLPDIELVILDATQNPYKCNIRMDIV